MSTILDAFFIFFYDISLGFAFNAYGTRIIHNEWINTCGAEMKAFLGLLIIMGVSKLPSLGLWSMRIWSCP